VNAPFGLFLIRVLAVVAPLGLLAWLGRTFPHRGLVLLALLPALAAFSLAAYPVGLWGVLILDLLIAGAALSDLLTLPRRRAFRVERQTGRIVSLKKPHAVTLLIENLRQRTHLVWVRDDVPPELEARPDEFQVRLGPRTRSALHYELKAGRRGAFKLSCVHVRVRSRWALWQRFFQYPVESVLSVYPDLQQLSEYALLARQNRLSLIGVRRARRVGQDNEFERLRDYTRDDNFRHIEWRSTARRLKLTVKDFQTTQSQRVVFLLDCGRMMTNEAEGLTLLDHALNALLMLSYVALARGDAVGLLCFSDEIHTYIPPRGGQRQMNRLLHASFDRFPRLVESRYDQAFLHLAAHCRRRSLVILITNVIDEVNAFQIDRQLGNLVGRHLPLGVLLRDRRIFEYADLPDPRGRALYCAAAAAEVLDWRRQVLSDLQSKGVLALDVFPESMTAPLVNRYLEIKARHLL
jgi:uncharacterized protein (DUF58 family)